MPKLSVIMGAYNCGSSPLLHGAISSILTQTYRDFEFIICDDGSSDCTWNALLEIQKQDSRIVLLRNETNCGLAHALNCCLSVSKGDYIARMDDDDYAHPQRFATQMEYLQENPDIAFVGCNVNLVQSKVVVGIRTLPEVPEVKDFYITQPFIHPSLLFRRKILDDVGGYSEEKYATFCEDYDLLLRLYTDGCVGANLQENLLDYSIPMTAKGSRKMRHRWNETVTRFHRFGKLKKLPQALPYVVKPLVVGLLPEGLLKRIKNHRLGG